MDIEVDLIRFSFWKPSKTKAAEKAIKMNKKLFTKLLVFSTIFCFLLFWCGLFFVCFFSCSFSWSRCTIFIMFIITIKFSSLALKLYFSFSRPVWAGLFPFPFTLSLWPFDFHLFRDSYWSVIFFNASFSTSPCSTSHITTLFLRCRLLLFESLALSSASLSFSLNRIYSHFCPYDKVYPFISLWFEKRMCRSSLQVWSSRSPENFSKQSFLLKIWFQHFLLAFVFLFALV